MWESRFCGIGFGVMGLEAHDRGFQCGSSLAIGSWFRVGEWGEPPPPLFCGELATGSVSLLWLLLVECCQPEWWSWIILQLSSVQTRNRYVAFRCVMNNWHSLRFRMSSSSCLCGGMCRSHVRDEVLWNWVWNHGAGSTSLRCPMWSSLVIGLWLRFGSWVRAPVFFFWWRIGHSIARCCGSSGTCDCCW